MPRKQRKNGLVYFAFFAINPHSPNSVGILDFHQMHKVRLMLLGKHEFDKLLAVILSKFQFFFIFGNDRNIYGFHFLWVSVWLLYWI